MQQPVYNTAFSTQLPSTMQDAIDFLQLVIPQGPFYYDVSFIGPSTPKGWRDEPHTSFLSMVQRSFALSSAGNNTYFALSAFRQGWHTITLPDGRKKVVFRTQQNAATQKALWLDIDCGKNDSPYANSTQAIQAVTAFIKQTHLPLPMVVSSGMGLHLYWTFHEAITTDQWNKLASMLKTLCVHFGLVVDHSRTMDAASVLRIPGTTNFGKDGVARPVSVLVKGGPYHIIDLAGTILTCLRTHNIQPTPMVSKKTTLPLAPVGNIPPAPAGLHFGNMEEAFQGPKRHPFRIIKECRQIQQAGLGTYTQWYNMMLVMKHCAFGERAVHDISKMDKARYEYNNVQTKYQQAIDGGYGPCRCETFDEKDPGICQTCPYWGKITTPLMLGEPYTETKPVSVPVAEVPTEHKPLVVCNTAPTMEVIPFSTKEFSVVPGQGVIWHKRQLVTGEEVDPEEEGKHYVTKDILISETEVYIHSICIDATGPELQRSYIIRKQPQGKAAEDIPFNISSSLGSQSLQKWLGIHGMLPTKPKYNKAMSDFMSTYLAAVQNRLPEIFIREHFGWVQNHDKTTGESYDGFIVGTKMYTQRGTLPVKLNSRANELARSLDSCGHLEVWKHIPKMYKTLNQPYGAMMMLSSFAAPFMRFGLGTAVNVAYSLWDAHGGKGKSTALEAAASVWGSPKSLLQTKSDTAASRFQKYAVYKNLPIFVDELTTMNQGDMADLVYDIVNGREKSRSTASGTGLAKSGTWSTITMMTSNRSVYETLRSFRIQSEATCMRVIEMQCDFQDYTGTPTQDYVAAVIDAIGKNYGLAGPAFLEWCFAHPYVFEQVGARAREFARKYGRHSDERFWLYGIGIPLAVGELTNAAGLTDYDLQWLENWCVTVLLPHLRNCVKQSTPTGSNLLSDFLNEHLSNTLSVVAAVRTPEQQDSGNVSGLDTYVRSYPMHALYVRHEADTNTYYVSSRQLQIWCTRNGISLDVMLQDLRRLGQWKANDKFQFTLGRNVTVCDRNRSMCYKFTLPQTKAE